MRSMDRFVKKPKFFKCFLTNITATKQEIEIWCQIDTKVSSRVESALDSLHSHLSDSFAINSQGLRSVLAPEVGQNFVTHMKNDLHFHRVVVTHIETNLSKASVLFIDFGVEDWVDFNHLVECEELFQMEPLAQKFFLADIHTKDSEWNPEEVKRCLQPFIMTVFQCEVISVTKNTECIRVYDQFFNQPLIQNLVKHCNGFLKYPSFGKEIFEAIDLSIDKKDRNKSDVNSVKNNEIPKRTPQLISELKFITELSFKEEKIEDINPNNELLSNKEDVSPSAPILMNGNFSSEIQISNEEKENNIENDLNLNSELVENEEILITNEEPNTESKDHIHELSGDSLIETINKEFVEKKESTQPIVSQVSEVNENVVTEETEQKIEENYIIESEPISTIEEISDDKCNANDMSIDQNDGKPISMQQINDKDMNLTDQISGDTTDQSMNGLQNCIDVKTEEVNVTQEVNKTEETNVTEEVNKREEVKITEEVTFDSIDLCLFPELVGQKESVYLTVITSDPGQFYAQLCSQFDVITSLSERMTDFYEKNYESKENELILDSLKVNDIIAARYSEDNLWYRASVTAINGTLLDVNYIDFGNSEKVEIKNCKKLIDDLFGLNDLKGQSILCQNIGQEIIKDTLLKYIQDMIEIECQFVSFENKCFKVKLSVKV